MTDMRKILAIAIVIAMACASMIIVSPNNTVTAEDSAKPLAELNDGFPGVIDKVTWHSDGSFALGVLSGTDQIWKYTRNTMTWTSEYILGLGCTFMDIKYSELLDYFYIVGMDAGQQEAWRYDENTNNIFTCAGG